MEQRGGADARGLTLEVGTAGELDVFEFLDAGEVAIDQAGVGERPEMFGWLQLGRIRRQEEQVDVVGDAQAHAGGLPAGAIEHQHDLFGRTSADLAGEGGELHLEERDRDAGRQVEEGATRGGMDEAHQVAPFEAVLHGGAGPLANRCPDAPEERFQANAMFVGGPELHLGVGEGRGHRSEQWSQFFLKASCCAASANAWRERGVCRLCLRRTK